MQNTQDFIPLDSRGQISGYGGELLVELQYQIDQTMPDNIGYLRCFIAIYSAYVKLLHK